MNDNLSIEMQKYLDRQDLSNELFQEELDNSIERFQSKHFDTLEKLVQFVKEIQEDCNISRGDALEMILKGL